MGGLSCVAALAITLLVVTATAEASRNCSEDNSHDYFIYTGMAPTVDRLSCSVNDTAPVTSIGFYVKASDGVDQTFFGCWGVTLSRRPFSLTRMVGPNGTFLDAGRWSLKVSGSRVEDTVARTPRVPDVRFSNWEMTHLDGWHFVVVCFESRYKSILLYVDAVLVLSVPAPWISAQGTANETTAMFGFEAVPPLGAGGVYSQTYSWHAKPDIDDLQVLSGYRISCTACQNTSALHDVGLSDQTAGANFSCHILDDAWERDAHRCEETSIICGYVLSRDSYTPRPLRGVAPGVLLKTHSPDACVPGSVFNGDHNITVVLPDQPVQSTERDVTLTIETAGWPRPVFAAYSGSSVEYFNSSQVRGSSMTFTVEKSASKFVLVVIHSPNASLANLKCLKNGFFVRQRVPTLLYRMLFFDSRGLIRGTSDGHTEIVLPAANRHDVVTLQQAGTTVYQVKPLMDPDGIHHAGYYVSVDLQPGVNAAVLYLHPQGQRFPGLYVTHVNALQNPVPDAADIRTMGHLGTTLDTHVMDGHLFKDYFAALPGGEADILPRIGDYLAKQTDDNDGTKNLTWTPFSSADGMWGSNNHAEHSWQQWVDYFAFYVNFTSLTKTENGQAPNWGLTVRPRFDPTRMRIWVDGDEVQPSALNGDLNFAARKGPIPVIIKYAHHANGYGGGFSIAPVFRSFGEATLEHFVLPLLPDGGDSAGTWESECVSEPSSNDTTLEDCLPRWKNITREDCESLGCCYVELLPFQPADNIRCYVKKGKQQYVRDDGRCGEFRSATVSGECAPASMAPCCSTSNNCVASEYCPYNGVDYSLRQAVGVDGPQRRYELFKCPLETNCACASPRHETAVLHNGTTEQCQRMCDSHNGKCVAVHVEASCLGTGCLIHCTMHFDRCGDTVTLPPVYGNRTWAHLYLAPTACRFSQTCTGCTATQVTLPGSAPVGAVSQSPVYTTTESGCKTYCRLSRGCTGVAYTPSKDNNGHCVLLYGEVSTSPSSVETISLLSCTFDSPIPAPTVGHEAYAGCYSLSAGVEFADPVDFENAEDAVQHCTARGFFAVAVGTNWSSCVSLSVSESHRLPDRRCNRKCDKDAKATCGSASGDAFSAYAFRPAQGDCPAGYVSSGNLNVTGLSNNSCFAIIASSDKKPKTLKEAVSMCDAVGGELASIGSAVENRLVSALLSRGFLSAWIGAVSAGDGLVWLNGALWSYDRLPLDEDGYFGCTFVDRSTADPQHGVGWRRSRICGSVAAQSQPQHAVCRTKGLPDENTSGSLQLNFVTDGARQIACAPAGNHSTDATMAARWFVKDGIVGGRIVKDVTNNGNDGVLTQEISAADGPRNLTGYVFKTRNFMSDRSWNRDPTSVFSVSLWVTTSSPAAQQYFISSGTTDAFRMGIRGWRYVVESEGAVLLRSQATASRTWRHLTISVSRGMMVMYVNGQHDSTAYLDKSVVFGHQGVYVGNCDERDCRDYFFEGALADLRVYYAALNAGDVLNRYTCGGAAASVRGNEVFAVRYRPLDMYLHGRAFRSFYRFTLREHCDQVVPTEELEGSLAPVPLLNERTLSGHINFEGKYVRWTAKPLQLCYDTSIQDDTNDGTAATVFRDSGIRVRVVRVTGAQPLPSPPAMLLANITGENIGGMCFSLWSMPRCQGQYISPTVAPGELGNDGTTVKVNFTYTAFFGTKQAHLCVSTCPSISAQPHDVEVTLSIDGGAPADPHYIDTVVDSTGREVLDVGTYTSGLNLSHINGTVVNPCSKYAQWRPGHFFFVISMGSVTDYIIPAVKERVCEALTRSDRPNWESFEPRYRVLWSNKDPNKWSHFNAKLLPPSTNGGLGGSTMYWPTDGRTYTSFWGNTLGQPGGCCSQSFDHWVSWAQPFSLQLFQLVPAWFIEVPRERYLIRNATYHLPLAVVSERGFVAPHLCDFRLDVSYHDKYLNRGRMKRYEASKRRPCMGTVYVPITAEMERVSWSTTASSNDFTLRTWMSPAAVVDRPSGSGFVQPNQPVVAMLHYGQLTEGVLFRRPRTYYWNDGETTDFFAQHQTGSSIGEANLRPRIGETFPISPPSEGREKFIGSTNLTWQVVDSRRVNTSATIPSDCNLVNYFAFALWSPGLQGIKFRYYVRDAALIYIDGKLASDEGAAYFLDDGLAQTRPVSVGGGWHQVIVKLVTGGGDVPAIQLAIDGSGLSTAVQLPLGHVEGQIKTGPVDTMLRLGADNNDGFHTTTSQGTEVDYIGVRDVLPRAGDESGGLVWTEAELNSTCGDSWGPDPDILKGNDDALVQYFAFGLYAAQDGYITLHVSTTRHVTVYCNGVAVPAEESDDMLLQLTQGWHQMVVRFEATTAGPRNFTLGVDIPGGEFGIATSTKRHVPVNALEVAKPLLLNYLYLGDWSLDRVADTMDNVTKKIDVGRLRPKAWSVEPFTKLRWTPAVAVDGNWGHLPPETHLGGGYTKMYAVALYSPGTQHTSLSYSYNGELRIFVDGIRVCCHADSIGDYKNTQDFHLREGWHQVTALYEAPRDIVVANTTSSPEPLTAEAHHAAKATCQARGMDLCSPEGICHDWKMRTDVNFSTTYVATSDHKRGSMANWVVVNTRPGHPSVCSMFQDLPTSADTYTVACCGDVRRQPRLHLAFDAPQGIFWNYDYDSREALPPVIEFDSTARQVTLKAPSGMVVFYSLDGKDPDSVTGVPYRAPFVVQQDTTVKAVAYVEGHSQRSSIAARYIDVSYDEVALGRRQALPRSPTSVVVHKAVLGSRLLLSARNDLEDASGFVLSSFPTTHNFTGLLEVVQPAVDGTSDSSPAVSLPTLAEGTYNVYYFPYSIEAMQDDTSLRGTMLVSPYRTFTVAPPQLVNHNITAGNRAAVCFDTTAGVVPGDRLQWSAPVYNDTLETYDRCDDQYCGRQLLENAAEWSVAQDGPQLKQQHPVCVNVDISTPGTYPCLCYAAANSSSTDLATSAWNGSAYTIEVVPAGAPGTWTPAPVFVPTVTKFPASGSNGDRIAITGTFNTTDATDYVVTFSGGTAPDSSPHCAMTKASTTELQCVLSVHVGVSVTWTLEVYEHGVAAGCSVPMTMALYPDVPQLFEPEGEALQVSSSGNSTEAAEVLLTVYSLSVDVAVPAHNIMQLYRRITPDGSPEKLSQHCTVTEVHAQKLSCVVSKLPVVYLNTSLWDLGARQVLLLDGNHNVTSDLLWGIAAHIHMPMTPTPGPMPPHGPTESPASPSPAPANSRVRTALIVVVSVVGVVVVGIIVVYVLLRRKFAIVLYRRGLNNDAGDTGFELGDDGSDSGDETQRLTDVHEAI